MKDFFATHCVRYKTAEERRQVRECAMMRYPDDDFTYWEDRWIPEDFPYMNYNGNGKFNMHRTLPVVNDSSGVKKVAVTAQEFLALFWAGQMEDEDIDFVLELI